MSILHHALPREIDARRVEAAGRLAAIRAEYPFASHFVEHDGVLQHYVDEGPRDGEVVLFLHGNPTWSFAWRRSIAALRGRYRCIAPDHVGCGLSDKPQGYSYRLRQHVENLERLVQHLGLRRLTLVLHDWGGAIGMGFARRHPEYVERLVVMNTAAFRAERMPLRIAACRIPVFGRLAVRGLNAFARAATFMAVERPMPASVKRGYLLPYDNYENRIATLAFVEDIPLRMEHPSYSELAATDAMVDVFHHRPALILWGERDWCFTPEFREEWERRLPGAEVHRFEKAGHYLFEDAADDVVSKLDEFLRKHPMS